MRVRSFAPSDTLATVAIGLKGIPVLGPMVQHLGPCWAMSGRYGMHPPPAQGSMIRVSLRSPIRKPQLYS
jgi:hypothetical protein